MKIEPKRVQVEINGDGELFIDGEPATPQQVIDFDRRFPGRRSEACGRPLPEVKNPEDTALTITQTGLTVPSMARLTPPVRIALLVVAVILALGLSATIFRLPNRGPTMPAAPVQYPQR